VPGDFVSLASSPTYYDVSTTATHTGSITFCVPYDPIADPDPSLVRLLHWNGTSWDDVTTSADPATATVCGTTTSLSPFVVAKRVSNPAAAPTVITPGPSANSAANSTSSPTSGGLLVGIVIAVVTTPHGLSASAAYFNINLANSNLNAVTKVFQNDGFTDYEGVEETLKLVINRWWSVDAAGQQLRAVENPLIDLTLKGMMPENTAKMSGNMLITHRSPLVRGLTYTAGASYLGRRYVNSNDQGAVPGFVLYNVGAGYSTRILGRKVAFQVNVDNLFNKAYWNSATSTAYGPGMVRSLKFNTRIEF